MAGVDRWRKRGRSCAAARGSRGQVGQVVRVEGPPVVEHDGVLHHVAQLAHVARPPVRGQQLARRRRELRRLASELPGEATGEELREEEQLGRPLAQRRHLEGEGADAVVEILAKAPLGHRASKLAVRGAEDADVDGDLRRAAEAGDGPRLEHAQQLGLQVQRHLADLVEEQGAAVRRLEVPGAPALGSGEGAALVAIELALEQVLRRARRSSGERRARRRARSTCARARRRPPSPRRSRRSPGRWTSPPPAGAPRRRASPSRSRRR